MDVSGMNLIESERKTPVLNKVNLHHSCETAQYKRTQTFYAQIVVQIRLFSGERDQMANHYAILVGYSTISKAHIAIRN